MQNEDKLVINNLKSLLKNEHYKIFFKKKQELKSKYPDVIWEIPPIGQPKKYQKEKDAQEYINYYRKLHQEYLRELSDLMFQPEGEFQQFTSDIMSETDKLYQERNSRERLNRTQGHSYT